MKPLAIDLFCGLGGWTDGLLEAGYEVIGFDIERHEYGEHRYPAQLVLQDVRTLHGSQFRDAALIVASPPCQEYSYMAMPWTRAKDLAADYRSGKRDVRQLTALFDACFRIQSEACEAAGRHIPLVVENVKGAQPWVGRARWDFGSYYLWGDVPALMPPIRVRKFNPDRIDHASKNTGGSWFNIAHNTTTGKGQNPDGRKVPSLDGGRRTDVGKGARFTSRDSGLDGRKNGKDWFGAGENCSLQRRAGSGSTSRKFASAMIAKIPLALSLHIARTFMPREGDNHAENRVC